MRKKIVLYKWIKIKNLYKYDISVCKILWYFQLLFLIEVSSWLVLFILLFIIVEELLLLLDIMFGVCNIFYCIVYGVV